MWASVSWSLIKNKQERCIRKQLEAELTLSPSPLARESGCFMVAEHTEEFSLGWLGAGFKAHKLRCCQGQVPWVLLVQWPGCLRQEGHGGLGLPRFHISGASVVD